MVYLISSLMGLFSGFHYENFFILLPVLAMAIFYLHPYIDGEIKERALACFLLFALFFARSSLVDTSPIQGYKGTFQARVLASEKKENSYQLTLKLEEKGSPKIIFYSKKDLSPGSRAIFQGEIQAREEASDWSTESYPIYLQSKGIRGQGRGRWVRVLKKGNFFYQLQDKIQKKLVNKDLDPQAKELFQQVLLSKKESNFWSDQLKDLGLAHILAISGLHIGLLYGSVRGLLIQFLPRRKALGLAYLSAVFYLLLIGGSIGGFRVLFFLLFTLISELKAIKFDYGKLFVFAACLQLLIFPLHLYSMGFYLSYGAYFSLIFIKPYLDRAFYPFNGGFFQLITASIAVNIGILPLLLAMQFEINLAQFLANILLLPFYSLFINASFLYGLGQLLGIKPYLFTLLLNSLSNFLLWGNQILLVFTRLKLRFGKASLEAQILFYLVLYLAYLGNKFRGKTRRLFSFCCLIFTLGLITTSFLQAREEGVYFIYVGQGDSSLIKSKHKICLVDTGGARKSRPAKKYLVPFLKARGVSRIDHIIITHWDEDHCDGLRDLAKEFSIGQVHFSHIYPKWVRFLQGAKIPGTYMEAGYKYPMDEGFSLDVLAGNTVQDQENNRSLVFYAYLDGKKILFTGDGEKELEDRLKAYPTDVYQVGHHGSKTSSGEKFLDQIKPKIAVISSGKNNPFGHPHQEVLDRLKNHGVATYCLKDLGCLFYGAKSDKIVKTGQEVGLSKYELLGYFLVLNGYMYGLRKVFKDHELLANRRRNC